MAINETQLAIQVAKRLQLPPSYNLAIQTMIPNALNDMAREAANDYQKRRLLVSDTVTVNLSGSTAPYYVDLTSAMANFGLMPDYLAYGDVFHTPAEQTFPFSAVNTSSDRISITSHGFYTGLKVRFITTDTLPSPLVAGTDYYIIAEAVNTIKVATTSDNAFAGTAIDFTTQGAGTNTVTPQESRLVQWIDAPDFGTLSTAIPLVYVYGWLIRNNVYLSTNATTGNLKFNVPFIPTLDTLPEQLVNDLIDALVRLATNGAEPLTEAVK